MKAETSRKRLFRSGCHSAHFLQRRGLANYCGPQESSLMSRAGMFGGTTAPNFEPEFDRAGPGRKKSEWDVC